MALACLLPGEKVLEVGTGSGATAEALAVSGAEVHSVELVPAYEDLPVGGLLKFYQGDGKEGLPSQAPFDAIVVSCGVKTLPNAWLLQLREGGRLVVPVGSPFVQRLARYDKVNGSFKLSKISAYVRFSVMR
jgi:protein-L-isoaspartate(D-aspartate) O-methyltransferase